MSTFKEILYPLIIENVKLYDFIVDFALDGCWVLKMKHRNEVFIDQKLTKVLGIKTNQTTLSAIFNEAEADEIFNVLDNNKDKINSHSKTVKVFHTSGSNVLQKVKFLVVENLKGDQLLVGAHENIDLLYSLTEEGYIYENIIEGTDLGTWEWNVQTGETKFNESWANIIGYTLSELEPISIETWKKYAHPEDLKKSNEALKKHFAGGSYNYELETRMKHKDGHWIWVLDKGKVFSWTNEGEPEWMVGSHQDITERKQHELELEKHRELLERTIKMAKVGVWEVIPFDNKTYWDAMTKSIHEVPIDFEPEINSGISFFPEGYNRDKILKFYGRAVEENIPYDIELQIKTLKGNIKWVRAIGIPEFENGSCKRIFGLFQDIDKIKKAQEESDELIGVTQEQNNRLMNFAHIVSHNLRSHSNNFSMLVSLLNQSLPEERKQKVFNMLLSASDKLKDTINHLDEIVDINLTLSDKFINLPLNKFVASSVDSLSTLAESKNIKINLQLDREYVVYGVPAYLESLTLNLLSNAIKYADPEKEEQFINIFAERVGAEVLLSFEDNGLGIDLKKYGDKLFGLYKTFHRNIDARGIGLFITRNQVEAMGGKISVNSKVGVGTTFTVHLKAKIDKTTTS